MQFGPYPAPDAAPNTPPGAASRSDDRARDAHQDAPEAIPTVTRARTGSSRIGHPPAGGPRNSPAIRCRDQLTRPGPHIPAA